MDKINDSIEAIGKLKKETKLLFKSTDADEIFNKIRNICKFFLNNFYVQVDSVTIIPLRVEAYYHNEKVNFIQKSCKDKNIVHCCEEQKKWCALHFHKHNLSKRNGVDLCLSDGSCFFSLLIKNALICNKFCSQSEIANKIFFNDKHSVQLIYEPNDKCVYFTSRVNINLKCGCENDNPIGALLDINMYKYNYNKGFGKRKTIEFNIELIGLK